MQFISDALVVGGLTVFIGACVGYVLLVDRMVSGR